MSYIYREMFSTKKYSYSPSYTITWFPFRAVMTCLYIPNGMGPQHTITEKTSGTLEQTMGYVAGTLRN